jgi:hypothetical protein
VIGVIFLREVLRGNLETVQWKRLAAAVAAAGLAFAAALAAGAVLQGLPALLAAGVFAITMAALTLWILHHRQGLRLHELLPWHPSWGVVAPVTAVEPGPMPDATR